MVVVQEVGAVVEAVVEAVEQVEVVLVHASPTGCCCAMALASLDCAIMGRCFGRVWRLGRGVLGGRLFDWCFDQGGKDGKMWKRGKWGEERRGWMYDDDSMRYESKAKTICTTTKFPPAVLQDVVPCF